MSDPTPTPLKLWIAGSSEHTLILAKQLVADSRFSLRGVITPQPKPVGRKQLLTPSPVAVWASQQVMSLSSTDSAETNIPIIRLNQKIDEIAKKEIIDQFNYSGCDLLLVVDFGYYVPRWLLALPTIAPINIHPSLLPRWRGSSPAQRVLLAGEAESAISVIVVTPELDGGPLIAQVPFKVMPNWTSAEYYTQSFALIAAQLPDLLFSFSQGQKPPQPQPTSSPTDTAAQLTKADSYVPWFIIASACGWDARQTTDPPPLAPNDGLLLTELSLTPTPQHAQLLERASRAFSPWPKLWSFLPTTKGWQRIILHSTSCITSQTTTNLKLEQVQIEGKQPSTWNEIKNLWLNN